MTDRVGKFLLSVVNHGLNRFKLFLPHFYQNIISAAISSTYPLTFCRTHTNGTPFAKCSASINVGIC